MAYRWTKLQSVGHLCGPTSQSQTASQVSYVIDLNTGDILHWLRFEGLLEELYDVVTLPGVRRPMALGLKSDEIRWVMSMGEPQWL